MPGRITVAAEPEHQQDRLERLFEGSVEHPGGEREENDDENLDDPEDDRHADDESGLGSVGNVLGRSHVGMEKGWGVTISYQLSAISYQLSAISYQLSAISYQLSAHASIARVSGYG